MLFVKPYYLLIVCGSKRDKALSKIIAGDILNSFYCYFPEKIMLVILCESSVWQTVHMKCKALFPLKNEIKIPQNAADVIGVLRVKNSDSQMSTREDF